ncbi:uncharacterized protein B0P05DRAFT_587640 [Gilbertella persicaria]|uniref:uncharacterized protein n=1 Tax=Gilbertella persicaria TaxID=101096 RepID=UPI0022208EED|nr:uncharacterized protein B0P05DRAFT_587640 [Gilbertella persicaria]KAI8078025.1 hypothetical protein B0P05DRAFT_587640 [Gilbertella persicaria]
MYTTLIEKRQVQHNDRDLSSYTNPNTTAAEWIMCDNLIENMSYNCEKRPYMTIVLIVTILIFIILRKSSYLHNWSSSTHQSRLKQQEEEEEEEQVGLMQRVVSLV